MALFLAKKSKACVLCQSIQTNKVPKAILGNTISILEMKKLKACIGNGLFFQKQASTIRYFSFYSHIV